MANTLRDLLGGGGGIRGGGGFDRPREILRIGVDERTNSILVLVPSGDQTSIEKLIKALDVETPDKYDPTAQKVEILALEHMEADDDLAAALQLVYGGPKGFALDRQRRIVLLSGAKQVREEAARVARALDIAAQHDPRRKLLGELRVRIVWLVSGLKREDAPAAPEDLSEVVAELARLGIDKPRLAAQVIVNAPLNAPFQMEGSAKLDAACRLGIVGTLTDKKDALGMEIQIDASRENEPGQRGGFDGGFGGRGAPRGAQICNLRTQIRTTLGHAVVLGVTPTDGMTSVFVVQVLRKEMKEEPRKGK
jgi:hypothetical protein